LNYSEDKIFPNKYQHTVWSAGGQVAERFRNNTPKRTVNWIFASRRPAISPTKAEPLPNASCLFLIYYGEQGGAGILLFILSPLSLFFPF